MKLYDLPVYDHVMTNHSELRHMGGMVQCESLEDLGTCCVRMGRARVFVVAIGGVGVVIVNGRVGHPDAADVEATLGKDAAEAWAHRSVMDPLALAHRNAERLRAWASRRRRDERRGVYALVERYLRAVRQRSSGA